MKTIISIVVLAFSFAISPVSATSIQAEKNKLVKTYQKAGYRKDVAQCAVKFLMYQNKCGGLSASSVSDPTLAATASLMALAQCKSLRTSNKAQFDDVVWTFKNNKDVPCG